ncbi:hypothetical protein PPL_04590 [Heterostelium album PN500]|uniref:Uncharacterized protein n=1 Tax=Heterostelium pallidum (strain ATCC 26659 / Pp 5 / PN500) TaxID=670386 RepID=D3B802_HETP5|nr:hypothetical protein PPL_04590 [Heterostelium album PN500]EFA82170.1 hypothetical protein PPL_04590 [Heterostelium album PN500]|eukprot:XP_020434287.1 hypothetical protein PPL_04590 [Heterostelium album PN500]
MFGQMWENEGGIGFVICNIKCGWCVLFDILKRQKVKKEAAMLPFDLNSWMDVTRLIMLTFFRN